MRRTLCCLLALGFFGAPTLARAQEPAESELEFVRKLRTKGYLDFAKSYLDDMQKRNDPALRGILPLEQARTLLAGAREKDAEQRFGLFGQAREFLKTYTDNNAGKPEAAQGTLELARLSTYEGQALLTKALRELEPAAQQDLAKPAEAKFILAAGELEAAIKLLEKLVDDTSVTESLRKQLKQELTQARFDKGSNFIDQARTYVNTSNEDLNLKRAQIVQEAKKIFDTLKSDESRHVSSQANAWLMKIAMESQDPNEIEKRYNIVMGYKEPEARAGQRWARLFDMQDAHTNAKNPRIAKLKGATDKLLHIQKLGQSWLKDYPSSLRSPEGEGVLWELANAYYLEAKEAEAEVAKKIKHKPAADVLYAVAQKYYGMLAQGEGDYSEKANKANLGISFQLMGKRKEFRTFEEWYLKGQFELIELQQIGTKRAAADPKDADKLDKEWKAKVKDVTHTFSRAIALATDRTPIQKLDEARYYLTAGYLLSGDLIRAAVAGEALGRTRPPTRRAPSGAGYAIDAYANLLSKEFSEGTKERLQNLVEYVLLKENQKFWSTDPVTGIARYQAALLYNRDGDYKRALEELESLPREFPAYIYAQGQLVFIALKVRREQNNLTNDEKKALTEKVRKAIERMPPPPLPKGTDSSTAFMYYLAQIEKSKIIYSDAYPLLLDNPLEADKKYREMAKFIHALESSFEKSSIKLTEKNRETIDFELRIMLKYAELGQAEVQYREQKFDEVLAVAKPTLDAVKKLDNGKDPIKMKDFQVAGDILGLALRAMVRKGNVDEAKAMLDMVKRLADEGDKKAEAGVDDLKDRVVGKLIAEISLQVLELKNKGDKKGLEKVVASFTTFLEALLKDTDAKKMSINERVTLARAFSGLDQHKKAAELYEQVQPPKLLESKKQIKDMTPEEQRELADYWSLKWEQVKELRIAKDYAGEYKVLDGYKEGDHIVLGWLKHPKALFQMPQGTMEKNFVMEDDGKCGAAAQAWNTFLKVMGPKVTDPKMKRLYYEGYFYGTRTLFCYGMKDPGVKSKDKVIDFAGKRIVNLEFANSKDGWEIVGDRFQELLKREPVLKESYDRQKAKRAASAEK